MLPPRQLPEILLPRRSSLRTPVAGPTLPAPCLRIAFRATRTRPRPRRGCPLAVSSCPRPARVRSTRRPWSLHRFLFQAPAIRLLAFNGANRSLIAVLRAALADTPNALRAALRVALWAALRDNSPAVLAPSTPRAPLRAVTPEPVVREHPVHVPALGLDPVLGRLVLAGHRAPVALRRPARLRVRSVHPPEAVVDARSIPRPRKVR